MPESGLKEIYSPTIVDRSFSSDAKLVPVARRIGCIVAAINLWFVHRDPDRNILIPTSDHYLSICQKVWDDLL